MNEQFIENNTVIALLRQGDNKVFEHFYKEYYRTVATLVLQNSGNEEDAKELFQDTMIAIFKKVRDTPDFSLNVKWTTFIYAVARNLWLKKLNQRKKNPIVLVEDTSFFEQAIDNQDIETKETEYEQKHYAIKDILRNMKKECREIIEAAFYKKLSGAAIAQLLGYTEDFVKVKKFRCMKELKEKVSLLNNRIT
jgi:RNA polymerase sigma factor (sigma-70 family)